ncbi:MAG: hypothetical protein A2287_02595 [Candidatus Melainabacteria bacterium RIFOXYA12_FULL_32_12]|nr:MAG: hypothetical protein A2255_08625 [Candidatus Melainabacteria bacterium RIFOXYA2_FULL_32_9]OGI30819.1 MAG: hypothetical protein A2287_02595 [Candidatus Melainabacteria bacterium RIFOXYA12_FULL_32_12]
MNELNRKAFTLAEILLTLTIVGIISSMTIPALLNRVSDTELITRWRKVFAEISNATTIIQTNYAEIDFTSDVTMRASYENVMQFIKKDLWRNISGVKYIWYENNNRQG